MTRRRSRIIEPVDAPPDTVRMTAFDLPLPAPLEQIETRATTKYSAEQMRRLVTQAARPLPRRSPPFATWMRRLCVVLVACALLVAGAVLGAAWVVAR